jgi:hypothetical protein
MNERQEFSDGQGLPATNHDDQEKENNDEDE